MGVEEQEVEGRDEEQGDVDQRGVVVEHLVQEGDPVEQGDRNPRRPMMRGFPTVPASPKIIFIM